MPERVEPGPRVQELPDHVPDAGSSGDRRRAWAIGRNVGPAFVPEKAAHSVPRPSEHSSRIVGGRIGPHAKAQSAINPDFSGRRDIMTLTRRSAAPQSTSSLCPRSTLPFNTLSRDSLDNPTCRKISAKRCTYVCSRNVRWRPARAMAARSSSRPR